jgi:hypothetical protein
MELLYQEKEFVAGRMSGNECQLRDVNAKSRENYFEKLKKNKKSAGGP